jgi:hypothetical protein
VTRREFKNLRRCARKASSDIRYGGGGGSRTRVREYAVAGVYMLSRSCMFATHVKERRKPWVASSDEVSSPLVGTAYGDQPAFMTSRPHPAGKTEVDVADLRFS